MFRTASTRTSSQEKPSPDVLSAPTRFVFHLMMISLLSCRPLSLIQSEFSFFVPPPHTHMCSLDPLFGVHLSVAVMTRDAWSDFIKFDSALRRFNQAWHRD